MGPGRRSGPWRASQRGRVTSTRTGGRQTELAVRAITASSVTGRSSVLIRGVDLSDWNKKNHANSALRTIVGEAEDREEELASAEAALTTRDEELTTRSSDLDTREGAIKGAEDVAALNTFAGEGTFRVGTDVQPGTYTSEGGSNCYWARLSATGDDIIDNNLSSGPQVLTVQASDGLIETSRCSPFTKSG